MSTFSGLSTAYSGLSAARAGLDVVAQNIVNANTDGYTRQRISTSAVGPVAETGLLTTVGRAGQGVSVDGITRIGNIFLDARVRGTSAASGYWSVRDTAMSKLEAALQEPGRHGLSAQLGEFWAAWQDLGNRAGEPASAGVLLEHTGVLTSGIARAYRNVEGQWARLRTEADGMVADLNEAGARVADLNARIRAGLATGANVNELLDQRSALTTSIAELAGGTVRETGDGTVEVLIGGNALVSGDRFRAVQVAGGYRMEDAPSSPVRLEWAHRPGEAVSLDAGRIGGAVAMLAPADGSGTGGPLAEAAASYNVFATQLADAVNQVHRTGETVSGATGLDFFEFDAALPAALGMRVVPTDVNGIAAALPGSGALGGGIADAIGQLGVGPGSPDSLWSTIVTGIGVASRSAATQSALADVASNAAWTAQQSQAGVDLDEENVNLLTFQVAYQGAARVITAVDELLDTLINRTGIVGR
ncbi:flagellar hook-associated protein FlgK [Cryobacterium sp. BB307]|uniref:flagellar hook-associated protein FlgK n=1 Tax=Cryobacterium sp. BB307 TaxID=2716317 RepID=UPI0014479130